MPLQLVKILCGGLTLAATLAFAADAHAGGCLKNTREIRLDKKNVVRAIDYLCRSDRDAQAVIRVQFQRLSGLAAGVLLNGGAAPWQHALYGKYQIANNDVLKEYKNLMARFGSAVRAKDAGGGDAIRVDLLFGTPDQIAKGEPISVNAGKGAEVRSFTLPHLPNIPLVDETLNILNTQTWPASLNMNYAVPDVSGLYKSPLNEMTVWRYLTPDDAKDYSTRLQRYNQLVADRKDARTVLPKSMQLLEYLTAGGWPDTFLYSSANIISDGGGCLPFDFQANHYSFVVDVAVIENVSSKPIQIDQFYGRSQGGNQLRKAVHAARGVAENRLQAEAVTLAPLERLVVPLVLIFAAETASGERQLLDEENKQRKLSQDRFQKITSSALGTVFRSDVFSLLRGQTRVKNNTYVIRKVREAFKPPSYPARSDFAFGPEWALLGLALGGEKISFEAAAPNFIAVTAAGEAGSCPILYAWEERDGVWVRYGKIIHQAQTLAGQASETVTFSGLVHRFLIAEEELERATIVGVDLNLELTDGRTLTLLPDGQSLQRTAAGTVELYANEEIEVVFALPLDLKPSDVVRSRLTVTGYYDRYPALLLSRQ